MLFYLKQSFSALNPNIFLPLCKTFIRPHLENSIQAILPILCRDADALEKVQKLAVKFVKGLPYVPYEAALKTTSCILPHTPANPWIPNNLVQDYPWSLGIPHCVHLRTSNPQRATRPRQPLPSTAMLYAPSPTRFHRSDCSVLEQITG